MRLRIWVVAAMVGAACAGALGQRYTFASYAQNEGLDNLGVNALAEDGAGFLWAGTEDGLFRFEGGRFRRYGQAEGLQNGFVYALRVDRAGRLWVGTDDGLYVGGNGRFTGVSDGGKRIQVAANSSLAELPGGRLLVLSQRGLLEVDGGAGGWTARRYPGLPAAIAAHSVLATAAGVVWVGCGNQLCELGAGGTRVWGPAEGVGPEAWPQLFQARDGGLWARSQTHVLELPPGGNRFANRDRNLPPHPFNDLYLALDEDAAGRVLTPVGAGVARWNGAEWELLGAAQGFGAFPISALLVTRRGEAWFGVVGHGVMRWLGYGAWQHWTPSEGLSSPIVWSVLPARGGPVWVATERGVDQLDPATGRVLPWARSLGPDSQGVRFLLQGADGHIWLVNRLGDALEYDPARDLLRRYPHIDGHLLGALADRENRVWIAATSGLYTIESLAGNKALRRAQDPAFDGAAFYDVAESPRGEIWASSRAGLFHLVGGRWQKIDFGRTGLDPRFEQIVPEDDGSVWVSNYTLAMDRIWIAGQTVRRVEAIGPPTLASDQIVFLRRDARGWLWVGTDHGVDVYDGAGWHRATQDNGLLWNDLDAGGFAAAADGSVWLGSSEGLSHGTNPAGWFRPAALRAVVTDLTLDGAAAPGGGNVFAWRGGALVAEFTELGAPSERSVRYRYRLAGLESGWTTTSSGEARYPQLAPGRYTFQVAAEDLAQHAASPIAAAELEVIPPWWRSWWFEMGLGMVAGLIVLLIWLWRERALLGRQYALETLVRERTKELEAEKRELLAAREALHVQATRDGLTQLWNRAAIFNILGSELERAAREDSAVAVVLVDLDHFKSVNDRFGHLSGDMALQEVARRFMAVTRGYDSVGRYGGEEFLIVLPGLALAEGEARLQQLRLAINGAPFAVDEVELRLSCSFGVNWVKGQGARTVEQVLELADKALYEAKMQGRDRVVWQ